MTVWNFSPGPAMLPRPVLEQAARGVLELNGSGASILEISHRSRSFEDVLAEAEAGIRDLLAVPPTHRILFCQGGASLQFSMVPMNLLGEGRARYVITGSWGQRALAEAWWCARDRRVGRRGRRVRASARAIGARRR
jgi:phosphoserine aminotransferase